VNNKTPNCPLFDYVYCCGKADLGNGNHSTEDGYKYRGHGAIQLTWKKTYEKFNTWLKDNYQGKTKDILKIPTLLDTDVEIFMLSALWYWKVNDLNKIVDNKSFEEVTLEINSKGEGSKKRLEILKKLKDEL